MLVCLRAPSLFLYLVRFTTAKKSARCGHTGRECKLGLDGLRCPHAPAVQPKLANRGVDDKKKGYCGHRSTSGSSQTLGVVI